MKEWAFIIFFFAFIIYCYYSIKRFKSYKALKEKSGIIQYGFLYVFDKALLLVILGVFFFIFVSMEQKASIKYGQGDDIFYMGPVMVFHLQANDGPGFKKNKDKCIQFLEMIRKKQDQINLTQNKYLSEKASVGILPLFYINFLRYNVTPSFMMNYNGLVEKYCQMVDYNTHVSASESNRIQEITDKDEYFTDIESSLFRFYLDSYRLKYDPRKGNEKFRKYIVYLDDVPRKIINSAEDRKNNIKRINLDEVEIGQAAEEVSIVPIDECLILGKQEPIFQEVLFYVSLLILLTLLHLVFYYFSGRLLYKIES